MIQRKFASVLLAELVMDKEMPAAERKGKMMSSGSAKEQCVLCFATLYHPL